MNQQSGSPQSGDLRLTTVVTVPWVWSNPVRVETTSRRFDREPSLLGPSQLTPILLGAKNMGVSFS